MCHKLFLVLLESEALRSDAQLIYKLFLICL